MRPRFNAHGVTTRRQGFRPVARSTRRGADQRRGPVLVQGKLRSRRVDLESAGNCHEDVEFPGPGTGPGAAVISSDALAFSWASGGGPTQSQNGVQRSARERGGPSDGASPAVRDQSSRRGARMGTSGGTGRPVSASPAALSDQDHFRQRAEHGVTRPTAPRDAPGGARSSTSELA